MTRATGDRRITRAADPPAVRPSDRPRMRCPILANHRSFVRCPALADQSAGQRYDRGAGPCGHQPLTGAKGLGRRTALSARWRNQARVRRSTRGPIGQSDIRTIYRTPVCATPNPGQLIDWAKERSPDRAIGHSADNGGNKGPDRPIDHSTDWLLG